MQHRCPTCELLKGEDDFYPSDRWSICKACRKKRTAAWHKANPEKISEGKRQPHRVRQVASYRRAVRKRGGPIHEGEKRRNREQRLRRVYGLTLDDYDRMRAAHDDLCAICRRVETRIKNGRVKMIAVDHDHVTGEVRGLLCHQCNTGIGCFKDDPSLLEAAIAYLRGARRFKPAPPPDSPAPDHTSPPTLPPPSTEE